MLKNQILIEQIDAILPQTQCRQCGYAGCKPYATAIANGEAEVNQCPPGGEIGIKQLATLLNVPFKLVNPDFGITKPKALAVIIEEACIGCTLCIQACPVDAILGATKTMHTVISTECTGCELCLPPCPMDCIVMEPTMDLANAFTGESSIFADEKTQWIKTKEAADSARERYNFRLLRLARDQQETIQKQFEQADLIKHNAAKALQNVNKNRL